MEHFVNTSIYCGQGLQIIQLNCLFTDLLSSTAKGQLQNQTNKITTEADTQDKTNKSNKIKKTKKRDQLRDFITKHVLLKISLYLQTSFAAETRISKSN